MNNEEKILSLLEKMDQRLDSLEQGQDSVQKELTRVAVTQENIVIPRLQLLAEGHVTIQEQIKNISVLDRLQDDVSTLKSAVRYLSGELEKLKNAI